MRIIRTAISDAVIDSKGRFWFYYPYAKYMCSVTEEGHVRFERYCSFDVNGFQTTRIFQSGDAIYIIGANLEVLEFNLTFREFVSYRIIGKNEASHYYPLLFDDKLYFIPRELKNKSYVYNPEKNQIYTHYFEGTKKDAYIDKPFLYKEELLFSDRQDGIVYSMNLENWNCKKVFSSPKFKPMKLCKQNERVYFSTSWSNNLFYYERKHIERLCLSNCEISEPYSTIVNIGDYIVALPRFFDKILLYNVVDNALSYIEMTWNCDKVISKAASLVNGFCVSDGKIICFPWRIPYMMTINLYDQSLSGKSLFVEESDFLSMGKNAIIEMSGRDINNFCDLLKDNLI